MIKFVHLRTSSLSFHRIVLDLLQRHVILSKISVSPFKFLVASSLMGTGNRCVPQHITLDGVSSLYCGGIIVKVNCFADSFKYCVAHLHNSWHCLVCDSSTVLLCPTDPFNSHPSLCYTVTLRRLTLPKNPIYATGFELMLLFQDCIRSPPKNTTTPLSAVSQVFVYVSIETKTRDLCSWPVAPPTCDWLRGSLDLDLLLGSQPIRAGTKLRASL